MLVPGATLLVLLLNLDFKNMALIFRSKPSLMTAASCQGNALEHKLPDGCLRKRLYDPVPWLFGDSTVVISFHDFRAQQQGLHSSKSFMELEPKKKKKKAWCH